MHKPQMSVFSLISYCPDDSRRESFKAFPIKGILDTCMLIFSHFLQLNPAT